MNLRSLSLALSAAALFVGAVNHASAALVNVAPTGTASQSSTLGGGFEASKANDGNRAGDNNGVNFTHTNAEATNNTWTLDLGFTRTITNVDIWNRTNCCSGRLRDITVEFLSHNGTVVASSPLLNASNVLGGGAGDFANGPGNEASIALPHLEFDPTSPISARSIRIVRTATGGAGNHDANTLSLAEVEVFVDTANLALGKPATQSSEYGGFPASNATNGNLGDFTHTASNDSNASLTVDLQGKFDLDTVVLFNRGGGCCPERLRDLTLQILDASGNLMATSGLINPANALASPASIVLDLHALFGDSVVGSQVRVRRASSGSGDDGNVLSLGEIQVFGTLVVIPEPATAALGLISLAGLAMRRRRMA